MPFSKPCNCGIGGAPVAQGAFVLTHAPFSSGSCVDTLSTLFFGWGSTSLIRLSTLNNSQSGDLAVAGSADLRAMAYNPANGFLYVADAFNRRIYKINPSTGAIAATFTPPGIGSVGSSAMVYCPQTTSVFCFTSATDFCAIDTNDVQQNGLLTAGSGQGAVWVSSRNIVLVAAGTVLNEINPNTLGAVSVAVGGVDYSGIDYSASSGQCLLGRTVAGAGGFVKYDPVAKTTTAIANAPAVAVRGITLNAATGVHFAVAEVSGLCYFISDNNFTILGQTNIGSGANPNIPLTTGVRTYVPSNGQSTITVFTP